MERNSALPGVGVSSFCNAALILTTCLLAGPATAFDPAVGNFDKDPGNHVRVLSWNVHDNFIWNTNKDAAFKRVIETLNPDVIAFQEIHQDMGTEAEVEAMIKARLEAYSLTGNTWYVSAGKGDGANRNVLCARWPISMQRKDTIPTSDIRGVNIGLIDLPDANYSKDLYVMNIHFKAGGTLAEFAKRQVSADAVVNWMRDARTAGGNVDLPAGTPMLVVGDFNISDAGDKAPHHPELTLYEGEIYDTATFGASSPPDWDGSFSGDAAPYDHTNADPATHGANNPGGRIDRFIYTDSVMKMTNRAVVNTVNMSSAALSASGLALNDSTASDHMPIMTDFQVAPTVPGKLLVNEFSANDVGTDDRTFIELINTGGEEINLDAPVDYWLKTSLPLPTTAPSTENEEFAYDLRGVVPPGGLFVLYNGATESAFHKAAIEANLSKLQRHNHSSFLLRNQDYSAFSLASQGRSQYQVTYEKNVDSYGYGAPNTNTTRYFMLDSGNKWLITMGPARWTSFLAGEVGSDLSVSRNLGSTLANSYADWTIASTPTPGLHNRTEVIVDNTSSDFSASGNWSTGTSAADKYGNDYRFRLTEPVSDAAVWNFSVPVSGDYEVYAWWSQGSNRSITAPFVLPDGSTAYKDQQTNGGSWQTLGVKSLAAGNYQVKLSCWTSNGSVVIGDAIKIVPR